MKDQIVFYVFWKLDPTQIIVCLSPMNMPFFFFSPYFFKHSTNIEKKKEMNEIKEVSDVTYILQLEVHKENKDKLYKTRVISIILYLVSIFFYYLFFYTYKPL